MASLLVWPLVVIGVGYWFWSRHAPKPHQSLVPVPIRSRPRLPRRG
jgi:hypothetical protein